MRPVTSAVRIESSRSKQRPRQTTPIIYSSQKNLIESFVNMRNTVEDAERKNKQFMQSIRSNEMSRSRRAASRSRERKPTELVQASISTSQTNVSLEMEIQRLNNKLLQQKKAKELLEQQLSLVESRCQREKSKLERVDKDYKSKMNSMKISVAKQLSQFSENVRDMFWRIDRKNNRNKQVLDDLNMMLKKQNKFGLARGKVRRSSEQGFKKKVLDDNKHIVEIGQKYQQLFLGKNEELEKLQDIIKGKDKQIREAKMLIDKLHCKEKEQGMRNSSIIEQLEGKISLLEKKDDLSLSLKKKGSKESIDSKDRDRERNLQIQISSLKQQVKEKSSLLIEFSTKASNLQKLLIQRAYSIQALQKDVYNQKFNKTQLLTQYQSAIERNKSQYKSKLQHILVETEQLKSTIVRKDAQLKQIQESESQLLNKITEMEAELVGLNQKLVLRQQLYLKPLDMKEDSMIMSRNSSIEISEKEDRQLETLRRQNRYLLLQKEEMRIEIAKLEQSKRRLDEEMTAGHSKRQQLEQSNKDLKMQILELQKQILILSKQQSLIAEQNPKTIEQLEIEARIVQSRNEELQKQNVNINAELIRYQHDLKLSIDLQAILEGKLTTFKNLIEESQRKISKLEEEIVSLNKITTLQRDEIQQLKFQQGYKDQNYKQELYVKSMEIQKLNARLGQMAGLQKQTEQNNNIRMRLQLKNKNLQEDIEQANKELSRVKLEYCQEIEKMKERYESLTIRNIENEETIKFQSAKISEIEGRLYSEEENATVRNQIQQLNVKIKILEQTILEFEIGKANIQRQLQQSDKLKDSLRDENIKLKADIQSTKQQCNEMIFKNEEKVQEQDKYIRALESSLKEKQGQNSGSKKSFDKSVFNTSNSLLQMTDFDMSVDQNFDLLEKLPHAFQKLHLKRKSHVKMMEKITEYINNLKIKIDDQNKVIKITNKRLEAFRSGDLSSKFEEKEIELEVDDDKQLTRFEVTSLKEVSIDRRHTRRIRALEGEKQLLMEQNNIFQRQVLSLQDQLLRADEEEKNYIRMKQIYKEEISRQRKAIQQKNQTIKKMGEEKMVMPINNNIEDSARVFVKIMTIVFSTQRASFAKKSEMEEYIRVISCLLYIDAAVSNWMIQEIRR